MSRELDVDGVAHAFGIPPWAVDVTSPWPRRRRIAWRLRHPRRWRRVLVENRKARG